MNWQDFASLITVFGVLVTCLVTLKNSREISKYSRDTTLIVAKLDYHNQLKMACIDKRLTAHQEAFSWWAELLRATDNDFLQVHMKCSQWWNNNCLYLDFTIQRDFLNAITQAKIHHQLVRAKGSELQIQTAWAKFEKFPESLFAAIQLPPLTKDEINSILLAFKNDL